MGWARERVRSTLSMRSRRRIAWSRVRARQWTGRYRLLPNLLIIGAQRCGTSSLYKYLGRHPEISPSLRKETLYFSTYFDKGEEWYRAHFPLAALCKDRIRVAFEATPDYMLDLRCAERVARTLGRCRVIAMLRDPVERAFSHYLHHVRLGQEPLSFDQALEREDDRLAGARPVLEEDPEAPLPKEYLRFSYAMRGRYAEQLEPWLSRFPAGDIQIIRAEDLFARPAQVLEELNAFLGVSNWVPDEFRNHSYGGPPPPSRRGAEMSESARDRLEDYFVEPNRRLTELLGRSFGWE